MDVAQPGDTGAVTILRRAAAETGRVSPAVASVLSRRALDLTPRGDPGRGPLAAETLAYLVYAGKAAEAVRLITAGAGDLADPAAEAEARLRLAHLSMQYASADVIEQCRRALELPGVPAALRVQLLSFLSVGLDLFGDAERGAAGGRGRHRTGPGERRSGRTRWSRWCRGPCRRSPGGTGGKPSALPRQSAAGRHAVAGSAVRLWLPDAWQAMISIVVARLDEAFALIDAGMRAAQQDGISANIRVWSMLRCRALFCSGRLADAARRGRGHHRDGATT